MSEKLYFDKKLNTFFEELYAEATNIEQLDKNTVHALAGIADQLRLGKTEITLDIPGIRIIPQGAHEHSILYDRQDEINEVSYELHFPILGSGSVDITFYPWGKEKFNEEESEILDFVGREIFAQYSIVMMNRLLNHVVSTDLATGAATSEALMQYAGKLLAMGRLQEYSALFFNIHNFKYVNKVFSYKEGDAILKNYTTLVREMLEPDEMLTRLGGDNFVALVKNQHQQNMISVLQNVRMSYRTREKQKNFVFGATIGYSSLDGIHVPDEIMARTSIAYQAARQQGTGKAIEYTEQIRQELMKNQSILSNFQTALEAGEFVVYYQPKVTISDYKICGAEALARWNRRGQTMSPVQFVPQLERDSSICRLDYYVLEEVCRFLKKRIEQGKEAICISVNFSRRHLEEEDLIEHIVSIIDKYGIAHEYIEIELTESQDYQNYEIMTEVVNKLRDKGIGTSMDDFGTGFSSLNMIKEVDLNVIKIDKSFIPLEEDYPDKKRDMMMFRNIVGLIKQLGKKTVAEGVETLQQLEYLKDAGCDIVQGYVFDKPLMEENFEERLASGYGNDQNA